MAKIDFRGYLCIAGGFDCKKILDSKSSDFKMKVGIFDGRNLKNKDILEAKNTFIPFNLNKR